MYPEARELTYAQFPTKYVWKDGWIRRSKGNNIGKIAYVHPTAGERYYLRLLLNIVKGPTSFDDLKRINEVVYPSYKEACYAYGLLSNDKEWHEALNEANRWAMPSQLRELLVTLILFCEVTDVKTLWENSYSMLSDDIERNKRRAFNHPTLVLQEDVKRSYTLIEIDKVLMRYGKSLKDIKEMPLPSFDDLKGVENKLVREEQMYDHEQLHQEWSGKVHQLNTEQLHVYEEVVDAAYHNKGGVMFLYGHGGTGKTFLYSRLGKFIVEGKIITGSKVGQKVIIPRIVMTSLDTKIPFILKRRQYSLRPCYAMTINKSQGQSLDYVGVYLPKPVFSHGQLYVAASRTTLPEVLRFYIDDMDQMYPGDTRNIVYKEVFTNLPN
ncbi:uncharacterized protein LOC141631133 [Silene latifolia]|uniref:uncharacterized protein LOC141631133 n=1 Tax=Silene latifolia TaxID=37657 RepID=UPI003D7764D8